MEPFPTSVLRCPTLIIATTTKICTSHDINGHLREPLHNSENAPPTHELKMVEIPLSSRSSLGQSLERHPFSGPVHSAGELLHYP